MNAGFISPSFRMLEVNWQHDFEMPKLGVPTFMGFLYRYGHRDLMHWDFDGQVCEALEADADAFDIKQYFDEAKVRGFLNGTDDSLRPQTEKLLATLGVTEREIYGISLAAVLDRIVNVIAIAAIGQCMSKVLKERHPTCKIVFGGLQVNPDELQEVYYRRFMEECPYIDYSFLRRGDQFGVQLYRNIWSGRTDRMANLERVLYRSVDANGMAVILNGTGADLDPDLAGVKPIELTGHHRAHTKAGATAQYADAVEKASRLASLPVMQPVSSSFTKGNIRYEETHHADGSEISARDAGDLEMTTLPASVPYFDRNMIDQFRYSGQQIMKRFQFNKEHLLRFSRFENDKIVVLPHIFMKGCNAPCGFCSYAYRPIEGEDVIETVEGLKWLSETYECRHFHFLNTQINSVYQYAEAFCDAVIAAKLDIKWSDCCNLRMLDEPLLEKMRRSGAIRLVYGVESPEDEMLRYIHKGVNVAKVERLVKTAHELGIWNHVLLIAGMPHETEAKLGRMMDFFRSTAKYIDYYTVSSYYLIAASPWGREPEKYGIERISSPDTLLEEQAFNEKAEGRWTSDNLKWPEKKKQIVHSTQLFYKTISAAKGQSRCVGGNIDLYMLMFLYDKLGHDKKDEIVKIYEETARTVTPSLHGSENGAADEQLSPESFRIHLPVVVTRMNEGDQSSLMQLPITIDVAPNSTGGRSWLANTRFAFSYKTPRILEDEARISQHALAQLKESLPQQMAQLGRTIQPLLRALEQRYAPDSPAKMATLAALNLPRYKPFSEFGYTVVGSPTGRSMVERMLQYSGAAS